MAKLPGHPAPAPQLMLSPQERHLVTVILLVLLLGAVVKSCRNRVTVSEIPVPKESVAVPIQPGDEGQD